VAQVLQENKTEAKVASVWKSSTIKIFTDSNLLSEAINDNRFQVVQQVDQAEVLHATQNIKQYRDHFGEK